MTNLTVTAPSGGLRASEDWMVPGGGEGYRGVSVASSWYA